MVYIIDRSTNGLHYSTKLLKSIGVFLTPHFLFYYAQEKHICSRSVVLLGCFGKYNGPFVFFTPGVCSGGLFILNRLDSLANCLFALQCLQVCIFPKLP